MTYADFLAAKLQRHNGAGFALSWMADSGETSFPLTSTVRLSLAQWQQWRYLPDGGAA